MRTVVAFDSLSETAGDESQKEGARRGREDEEGVGDAGPSSCHRVRLVTDTSMSRELKTSRARFAGLDEYDGLFAPPYPDPETYGLENTSSTT